MDKKNIKFAFFGSSRFSVIVLDQLEKLGLTPVCLVTTPDAPKGRKLELSPTAVKIWGRNRDIEVFDPRKLTSTEPEEALPSNFVGRLRAKDCDLFVVASYGKIIPDKIINVPKYKTLNIHPSLLPKYRGASPLQSAMLDDTKETGVTVMRIDEQMDHGPVVAQEKVTIDEWPVYEKFEEMMAIVGGKLLAKILPEWISGKITEHEQDHSAASYTRKISKDDGLVDLSGDSYLNFRKIQAYHEWPQAYFLIDHRNKKIRVKITHVSFRENKLSIEKVIPEGGREMSWADFSRGYQFKTP